MEYGINFALAIIGILVSAIGVRLALKQRYPGKVTLLCDDLVNLKTSIFKNYLNQIIDDSDRQNTIFLFRGALLNDGSIDITSELTEKPITVEFTNNCKWQKTDISHISNDLKCRIEENDKELKFELGQFRKRESISFQSIIISTDTYSKEAIENAISPLHRIGQTGKIRKVRITDVDTLAKTLSNTIYWFLSCLGFIILSFYASFNQNTKTQGHTQLAYKSVETGNYYELLQSQETFVFVNLKDKNDTIVIDRYDMIVINNDTIIKDNKAVLNEYFSETTVRTESFERTIGRKLLILLWSISFLLILINYLRIVLFKRELNYLNTLNNTNLTSFKIFKEHVW